MIRIGDRVYDFTFHKIHGIVTSVVVGHTIEDHGCIEVMLDNNIIEHYSYYGWEKILR